MAIRGYTNVDLVQGAMGLKVPVDLIGSVQQFVADVEPYIDRLCKRGWLLGTITDEAHFEPSSQVIYVRNPPISSVTSVKARSGFGSTEETLVVNVDWEVRDLEVGSVYVDNALSYDRLRITYVQSAEMPGDIRELATGLVAIRTQRMLLGLASDVQGTTVGGDTQIQFLSLAQMPFNLRILVEANTLEHPT